MSLNTIIGKIERTNPSRPNRRSLSNLQNNHNLSPSGLAQGVRSRGWECMQIGNQVYIAQTNAALKEFRTEHPEGTYVLL